MFAWIIKGMMRSRCFSRVLSKITSGFMFEGVSYSQNFEDQIIKRLIKKERGLYVDVGAHHPIRFSNTYQLYLNGWNGINIDPIPGGKNAFKKYRSGDLFLPVAVSNKESVQTYYSFEEPAYNTMNKERAEYLIENGITRLKDTTPIKTVSLKRIFDKFLRGREIDVLTVDVETLEYEVLSSNNWTKYRPEIIVMESLVSSDKDLKELENDRAILFLRNMGYMVVAKIENAVFLRKIK